MVKLILEAVFLGLMLTVLIGPVFFALIKTSIVKGLKAALFFALGIMLSDLTCLLLANWGASRFVYDQQYARWIGIVGGVLLMAFGLYEIIYNDKEVRALDRHGLEIAPKSRPVTNVVKAYLMNIMTPFVFIFWIVWAGVINARYGEKPMQVVLFFAIVLLTVFFADGLKAYLSSRLGVFISGKALRVVRVVAGSLLIIFGVYLLLRVSVYGVEPAPTAIFGLGM